VCAMIHSDVLHDSFTCTHEQLSEYRRGRGGREVGRGSGGGCMRGVTQ